MPEELAEKLGVEYVDTVRVAYGGDRYIPLPLIKLDGLAAVVVPADLLAYPVPRFDNDDSAIGRRIRQSEVERRKRDHTPCVSVFSDRLKHVYYDQHAESLYADGLQNPVEVRSLENYTGADPYLDVLVQAVRQAAAPRPPRPVIRYDQPAQPHALPDDHAAMMAYAKIRDQQAMQAQLQQNKQQFEYAKKMQGQQSARDLPWDQRLILQGRRMNATWKADVPGLRFQVPKIRGIGYGPAKKGKRTKGLF